MRIASRSVSSAPHCHTPCYGFQAMPPALGGVVFTSGTGKRPCPRGKAHRMDICFAHTLSGEPPDRWQPLEAHLRGVAEYAAANAAVFGAHEWGYAAGLWHDLGKCAPAFQEYLRAAGSESHQSEVSGRVDHSTAGAQHAVAHLPVLGHLLAFALAGHHSGLLDSQSDGPSMLARLGKQVEPWDRAPKELTDLPAPALSPHLQRAFGNHDGFSLQFFVRMVFSCLVDADFLDTEAFMSPPRAAERPRWPSDIIARMTGALDTHLKGLASSDTEVNRQRGRVLQACRDAAPRPPGFFTLTVPTGGGKTLSSLVFALEHARRHRLRRVVYVVPFTSIIEQNAAVFRSAMRTVGGAGTPGPVLEHHSNLDPDVETTRSRLATENWDAPLVVTTAVQFYESLFANRTSRCRKLHNLAGAVVILDEAQSLPVDFLSPCLRALRELVDGYGSTVVLCTATQPAVARREDFEVGLELGPGNEIVPDAPSLFTALKRVEVERAGPLTDEELAEQLLAAPQVLCIVNTRGHARRLWDLLGEDPAHLHLSGLMCPEHRSVTLEAIRDRLDRELPCRVVSTQLVEAGVDIDFPVVYRAMAGLDSLAQAAGRCNRNGRHPMGRTVLFQSEHESAEAFLRDMAQVAREILPLHEDPLSLEAVEHYFRLYYWTRRSRWDHRGILGEFKLQPDPSMPFLFGFARAASRFRIIEDTGRPIIVPWGPDGHALREELEQAWGGPSWALRRRLQRYVVQVPQRAWDQARGAAFTMVHDQYAVLVEPRLHYSDHTGLVLTGDHTEALIIGSEGGA